MNIFRIPTVIIILSLSIFTPLYSNAQSTSWDKPVVVGHILNEYLKAPDGKRYTVGANYLGEEAKFNNVKFPETNLKGGFLIETDSSFAVNWEGNLYNIDWSHLPNIAVDPNSNLYLAFSFRGSLNIGSIMLEQGDEEVRIAVMKLDSEKNLKWIKYIKPIDPTNVFLVNYKLKIDSSGNIYLLGNAAGGYGFYTADNQLQYLNNSQEGAFIAKYSLDGDLDWVKILPESGPSNQTYIYDFVFDKTENIYFTGMHYGEGNYEGVVQMSPYPQIMVGSLSSEGKLNWIEFLGEQVKNDGPNDGYAIAVDDNLNAVYVTGSLRTRYGNESSTEGKTAVLFRLDLSGNYVWHKRMGSSMGLASRGPTGSAVAIDKNGDPIVSGLFWNKGTFGDFELQAPRDPNVGNIFLGIFVTKLSSSGEFLWADFAGSDYDDNVKGIEIHKPGELTLYGNTRRDAVFGENRIGMDESLDVGFIATLRYSDPEFLGVGTNYFTFDTGEEADSLFEISSNVNWTITSDQEWLVPEKMQGSGNSLVSFSVNENLDFLSRNAALTVRGENGQEERIRVRQEKGYDLITGIPEKG